MRVLGIVLLVWGALFALGKAGALNGVTATLVAILCIPFGVALAKYLFPAERG